MAQLTHEEKNQLIALLQQKNVNPAVAAAAIQGLSSEQVKALTGLIGHLSPEGLSQILAQMAEAKKAGEKALEAWFQKHVVESGAQVGAKPSSSRKAEPSTSAMPTGDTQNNVAQAMQADLAPVPAAFQAIWAILQAAGYSMVGSVQKTQAGHQVMTVQNAQQQQSRIALSPQGKIAVVAAEKDDQIAAHVAGVHPQHQVINIKMLEAHETPSPQPVRHATQANVVILECHKTQMNNFSAAIDDIFTQFVQMDMNGRNQFESMINHFMGAFQQYHHHKQGEPDVEQGLVRGMS